MNKKFAIVVARFNELITKSLTEGAKDTFLNSGIAEENIHTHWVAGAFEIPLLAQELTSSGQYAAIVCLGAVIKGATDHYDYVCSQVASGIMQVGLKSGVPCIFGVLTTNTLEEALDRAGGKSGNKGREAAYTAIEMAKSLELIRSKK